MHCYVINLPDKVTRLQRTAEELKRYCPYLTWSIPRMSISTDWTDEEFKMRYDGVKAQSFFGRDLSRGEVACALSHQSAMKEFLASRDNSALIVEDDVLLSPAIGNMLLDIELWLRKRTSKPICIVLSEAAAVRLWTARRWLRAAIKRTSPIEAYGAIAYVLNRKGAEKILNVNPTPIFMTSDNWRFYARNGLRVYGVTPFLAGSYDFGREDSSLAAGRAEEYRKRPVLKGMVGFLNRVATSLKLRLRSLWWFVSGVNQRGMHRSNDLLYRAELRSGK